MVYSWNVCVNVPMPELHMCKHCNVDLHLLCCSRQSPHRPNPLAPVWCSISRDCRRLIETERKGRHTWVSFIALPGIKPTFSSYMCASEIRSIRTHIPFFWCPTPCEHPCLSSLICTYTFWPWVLDFCCRQMLIFLGQHCHLLDR